jgi:FtsH-binding integral membrane protein
MVNPLFHNLKEKASQSLKTKLSQARFAAQNHGDTIRQEVREKTVGYMIGGLGVVAGLAWNDAISSFIEYLFPLSKSGIVAKFLYAAIITLFVVLVTVYLMRWSEKG